MSSMVMPSAISMLRASVMPGGKVLVEQANGNSSGRMAGCAVSSESMSREYPEASAMSLREKDEVVMVLAAA